MRPGLRALAVCAVLAAAVVAAAVRAASAAEPSLPPAPKAYFNDYAGVVAAADADRLEAKLRRFDEETSSQVLVAIFRRLPSPSLEDFTVRVAESWKAGRRELDNGAVFFVFVDDRRLRIEVGYGLEGALPDALARRILDDQVVPRLRVGDWAGGIEAGVDAILAATRGEYRAPPKKGAGGRRLALLVLVVLALLILLIVARQPGLASSGRTYGGSWPRRGRGGWDDWSSGGGGWSSGGGGWSSGGGGWSSGGGFSGGGGSFGGGGASSSW